MYMDLKPVGSVGTLQLAGRWFCASLPTLFQILHSTGYIAGFESRASDLHGQFSQKWGIRSYLGKFQTFFKYFESFFRVPNLRVPFAQVLQQSDLQGLVFV